MTGEKNKGTNLEKLWNLDDKQLTTPKHDELVLGITQQYIFKTFPSLVTQYLKSPENWTFGLDRYTPPAITIANRATDVLKSKYNHISDVRFTTDGNISNLYCGWYDGDKDEYRRRYIEDFKIEIEHQKTISENGVSLYNTFKLILQELDFSAIKNILYIKHEEPITQKYNGFIIGYWDCKVSFNTELRIDIKLNDTQTIKTKLYDNYYPIIYIEAKPYIDSYGAVIRQLKTYQNFLPNDNDTPRVVCLLTPDATFNDAFESQDITVITP